MTMLHGQGCLWLAHGDLLEQVWAFPCKEEEYGKDTFLEDAFSKFPKQKKCCIGVAFRKFSSGIKEELVEKAQITPLH